MKETGLKNMMVYALFSLLIVALTSLAQAQMPRQGAGGPPPGPIGVWEFYLVPHFPPGYLERWGVLAEDASKTRDFWTAEGKTSAESLKKFTEKMQQLRLGLWQETSQESFEKDAQEAMDILKEVFLNRFKAFQQTRETLADKANPLLWGTAWFPAPGPTSGHGMGPGMMGPGMMGPGMMGPGMMGPGMMGPGMMGPGMMGPGMMGPGMGRK